MVLASAAGLVAALALWVAAGPDPQGTTLRGAPPLSTATPAAAPDPFAGLEAIGWTPAAPPVHGSVAPDIALVFAATLLPGDPSCSQRQGDRCPAGCFHFVAVARDGGASDLVVRVSPLNAPGHWLAVSPLSGARVDARLCHEFAPDDDGARAVRVEVRSREGAGEVAVGVWREGLPADGPATRDDEPTRPWITGEPLSVDAGTTPAPETVRWMGSDPHVPLVEVVRNQLGAPGSTACVDWPMRRQRWIAVDAWGQPTGVLESTGAEGYDVTACYEMRTRTLSGDPGVGLLASAGYRPGPSFRDEPDELATTRLRQLVERIDAVFGVTDKAVVPVFFRSLDDNGRPTRNVAMGGRALVIAESVDHAWIVRHIETGYAFEPAQNDGYRVLAVLDLDGDGRPEIAVRRDMSAEWNDAVLVQSGATWTLAIESVGGATI